MDSGSSAAQRISSPLAPAAHKLERRVSDTHGSGVFATQPIHKGEHLVTYYGPLLHKSEVDWDDYHLQIGEEHYLGASGDFDDYINHSCNPNAGFKDGLYLVARRDIAVGEEITLDYSTVIDEDGFEGITCQCGETSCRGAIQSFRHLAEMRQQALRPWLLPYLREKYYAGK